MTDSAAMPAKPHFPVQVFYDGSCSVCATEIKQYLRRDHGDRLVAVDISDPGFNPEPFHIPLEAFMYELHVIDQRDVIYRGVEAFWAIWQAFPASTLYGVMGTIISMPLVNPVARLMYKGFARFRRYLPKRHVCNSRTCDSGRR
jgi:predicted DCC family thiol-disulfide oxidoreductase YuxK